MKIIILAGGFATRLWPLTEKTAKPLLKVGKKTIASHLVDMIPEEHEIIVSTNQVFGKDFEQWKKNFPKRNIEIFLEDSQGEQGKKGALAAVSLVISEKNITEDILVLAGDNLFFFDVPSFLEKAKENPLLAAYDVGNKEEAKQFGVVVAEGNRVLEFQEKPDHPKSTLVSTGVLYFPARLLSGLQHFAKKNNDNLGGVFEYFLEQGEEVSCFRFTEAWFDIGSFPAFLEAQQYLIGERVCDEGADQSGKNSFSGAVLLEKGSSIYNAELENVVIESGARVENVSLRNTVIGKNSFVSDVDLSFVALREESVVLG